jgi:N utilization substance protein A
VRLASKLVGWDIHVMNQKKLDEQLNKSVGMFSVVPGVSEELAENLVEQGFFTFDDLSVIEPDQLAELGGLTPEQCEIIIAHADTEAARVEEEERRAIAEGRFKVPTPATIAEVAVETLPTTEVAPLDGVDPLAADPVAHDPVATESIDEGAHADSTIEKEDTVVEETATIETPTEESDAAESPRRGVEHEAAQVPKRANGEQSPSLEAAALDEQAEE